MKNNRSVPGLFLILFLIFGVSSYSLALEVPVFSPLRYAITDVQGTAVYTDTVTMGNVQSGEFHLVVQNGSGGKNKVDYAEVYVAGKRLVKMKSTKDLIDKKFKLVHDSEMRVQLTGPKNSFVVVSIIAKKLTQVPLVIRMAQADAQAAMTASLLKIKKKPTFASHGYIRTGSVMSQTPKAGVYVKEKSKASITVSTGPARSYDLLPGDASSLASAATVDYNIDDKVAPSEIETIDPSGVKVARSKLLIAFTPDATVGQINTLLTSIHGTITAMLKGVNQVMVRLSPAPASLSELDTLINTYLTDNPNVRYVQKATMPVMASLPSPIDPTSSYFDNITHQLDVRAHAAWNTRSLIKSRVSPNIIVADGFGDGSPNTDFAVQTIDPFQFNTGNPAPDGHGYHVLGIMAGTYGGDDTRGSVTGMYPGSGTNLLTLFAVDAQWGYSFDDLRFRLIELLQDLRASHQVGVILNTSLGRVCPSGDYLDKTCIEPEALAWLELVRGPTLWLTGNTGPESLENMFLHVTAAGNTRAPGDTDAVMASEWTAARLLPGLVVPGTTTPLMNLTNTLVIENRDRSPVLLGGTPGCLAFDSKFPGNLSAIGENVFSLTGNCAFCYDWESGTSQATPQVAGLAAYMWTIKPGLTPQQIMDILIRTADSSSCGGFQSAPVIDSYAAVLALDRNYPDMEVRRAILDLNEDRFFDENDVERFLTEFDDANGEKDYSRYDLNGDGKTGGDTKAKLNLDMDYPLTYTTVSQKIEETSIDFDENSLSDLQILCYYAYSRLYTGDTDKLKELLENKCSPCEEVEDGFEEGLTANYSNGRQAFEGPINHGWDWSCPSDSSYEYNMYQNVCTQLSLSPVHWAKGGWEGEDDTTAFNVSWNGYLFAPKDGAYYFGDWVDGIVYIEIDGQVVANMDTTGSSYGYTMTLQGRNWVPISMSFSTNGGSNNMRLKWRVPGVSSTEYVPKRCLKHHVGP
jgi:subtilisin family serine protease